MPSKLFFELHDEKKMKIMKAAISEFAAYGYINASTNTIVKNSGISKGSLFKYFTNKEELYFYLLDMITAELIESMEKQSAALPPELFQRVIAYSTLEFSWYVQNPVKSKLIIGAFTKSDTEIYHKTAKRYGAKELDIFYKLLEDVDWHNFRWDRQKTTHTLKWFLKGFNEDFLANVSMENHSFAHVQNTYIQRLTEYLEILKYGLLK